MDRKEIEHDLEVYRLEKKYEEKLQTEKDIRTKHFDLILDAFMAYRDKLESDHRSTQSWLAMAREDYKKLAREMEEKKTGGNE